MKILMGPLAYCTILAMVGLLLLGSQGVSLGNPDPTFQEVASSIYGQPVGKGDSGDLYVFGLTSEYVQPEYVDGVGPYKSFTKFLPVVRWYRPQEYWVNKNSVEGVFKTEECVLCHTVQTPTIVNDWRASGHANPRPDAEAAKKYYLGDPAAMAQKADAIAKKIGEDITVVGCDKCHGNDHQKLQMPTWQTCQKCHPEQTAGHRSGGLGSHTHAWTVNVLEFSWQLGKPPEEVNGCQACHAIIENRCDGCHTRHKFNAAESRQAHACRYCHLGVDHREWEMYSTSMHGILHDEEQSIQDWTKPLKKGNHRVPGCAYCHMQEGDHNVQRFGTIYSDMGMFEIDRGAPKWAAKREAWIKKCMDCHSPNFARDQLRSMDYGVRLSFTKWREAANVIVGCFLGGELDPMPTDLAPDWYGHYTFSLLPTGDPRFYNVSDLERMGLEMICYLTDNVYKALAHMAIYNATYGTGGAFEQDRMLIQIKAEASRLKRFKALEQKAGIEYKAQPYWKHGEYLDLLTGWKRKEGDVDLAWFQRNDIPHRHNADSGLEAHVPEVHGSPAHGQ
ncbi:MAG TPA: multiheme c-type cytochrome [Candidatus Avalokitesvara rifleensis]|uniref:multiheme c-type cytochrome n=1 Tax=Candidatus Avalokitesvara rifleensis TaxID=3367620 RepID=UPI002712D099|nr:multiheme c-type cytochrome [Candidatus Brocadiales bacterium]